MLQNKTTELSMLKTDLTNQGQLLLENSLYSEDHMEDSSIPLNLTLA
jgi:hypothetical protein